ncbi:OsmC/Ohr family protein [Labilithrix luteola]|uniref:OsmC/Ohr family protein n=1 Tax=Labilithrix luteola TaxID=1391654 RepID=A0A0K1PZ86_9BACT|nr:OsmC family protein [Labilithrix luteola]AKU98845.1 OsmC/Ohr family protein [Labilithrix luteola]
MSSTHRFAAHLEWTGAASGPVRDYEGYSREYRVDIEGKPSLRGSAAPPFRGSPELHNPEDLLVASLSACHCLSYLALCARAGIVVLSYEDDASGVMAFDRTAKVMKFSEVMLRPRVRIAAGADVDKARALHETAHHECFIANSVNFPVRNEPLVTLATLEG